MPAEIFNEYPCKLCKCETLELVKTITFYCVEPGMLLIEEKFDYNCFSCKKTLMRVIKHKEEKVE